MYLKCIGRYAIQPYMDPIQMDHPNVFVSLWDCLALVGLKIDCFKISIHVFASS